MQLPLRTRACPAHRPRSPRSPNDPATGGRCGPGPAHAERPMSHEAGADRLLQRPAFETLRWVRDRLEMLDQRLLPTRVEYRSYDSAAGVAEGIRTMVVRGAPAIGCAAAYGIALAAQQLRRGLPTEFAAGMNSAFTQLAASRPTAVNLFWALQRMRRIWDELP